MYDENTVRLMQIQDMPGVGRLGAGNARCYIAQKGKIRNSATGEIVRPPRLRPNPDQAA